AQCEQTASSASAMPADLGCNDDSFDQAPHSTVFLSNIEQPELFIIVDGNQNEMRASSVQFRLTVSPVTLGTEGSPCRPEMKNPESDPATAMRCNAPLRCSAATELCVQGRSPGTTCDPLGFRDTCMDGAMCA